MAIPVFCSGCRTKFNVSDKFAGKSGACPKCKATIVVPAKTEAAEVTVHAPTQFADGGRGASGKLALKPIARIQTKWNPVAAVAIAGAVLVTLLLSWAAGGQIRDMFVVRAVGLLLVSPPLVVAAYLFLRKEDDLEPYHGKVLYVRAAICALVYAILWGVEGHLAGIYLPDAAAMEELWNWLFVAPPLLLIGSLAALACLDLDFGSGFFHYSFYLMVTMVLRWAAGMGWPWNPSEILPL